MDRAACEAHFARAYDSGREAVISIADPGGRRLLPEDVMRLDLDIHDYTPAEAEAERLPVVLFTGEDRDRILDFGHDRGRQPRYEANSNEAFQTRTSTRRCCDSRLSR